MFSEHFYWLPIHPCAITMVTINTAVQYNSLLKIRQAVGLHCIHVDLLLTVRFAKVGVLVHDRRTSEKAFPSCSNILMDAKGVFFSYIRDEEPNCWGVPFTRTEFHPKFIPKVRQHETYIFLSFYLYILLQL